MPDPAGYSIPIVNRDEFAKHFLHAANDKLKPKEDRKSEFDTENGGLWIRTDVIFGTGPPSSVTYRSFEAQHDIPKQIEFINNFMNKMGFKMTGKDVASTQSIPDNCHTKQ